MASRPDQPPFRLSHYGTVATVLNLDPEDDAHWADIEDEVRSIHSPSTGPLAQLLSVVRGRGCRTIVVEREYVDQDYRSEFSAFWSRRFEDRPARVERLHFFSAEFSATDLPNLPAQPGYLGYCVLRPTRLGAVGRTVIVPPENLRQAQLTYVVDRPSLYGNPLVVAGVPFCQQDGELLRCAHAAAWMCHYVAYHRGVIARYLTAEIADMPSIEASRYRPLPSTGLTGEQLQAVFSNIGIPAFLYDVANLPDLPAELPQEPQHSPFLHPVKGRQARADEEHDERIWRVVCKYLNSGFPVVVLTKGDEGNHAFTLVGWERMGHGIRLIACDDQIGPYEIITSPSADGRTRRGQWKALMIPLPSRVFLTGEAADIRARAIIRAEADQASIEDDAAASDFSAIAPALDHLRGPVSVRARLVEGRRFKAVAGRQGRDADALRVIRMAHLPHWVWLIEFQHRRRRDRGEPCVLAEILFDSTSHNKAPVVDLMSTTSVTIDSRSAAAAGPIEDTDDPEAQERLVLGRGSGQPWRSMISDVGLDDREYEVERFGATGPQLPAREETASAPDSGR